MANSLNVAERRLLDGIGTFLKREDHAIIGVPYPKGLSGTLVLKADARPHLMNCDRKLKCQNIKISSMQHAIEVHGWIKAI